MRTVWKALSLIMGLASIAGPGPGLASPLSMNWYQATGSYNVKTCLALSQKGMERLKLKNIRVSDKQVKGETAQLLALIACVPNQKETIKTIMVSGSDSKSVNQLVKALAEASRPR